MRRVLSVLLAAAFMVSAPAIIPQQVEARSLFDNLFPRAAERRRERAARQYRQRQEALEAWERERRGEKKRAAQAERKRQRARARAAVPVKKQPPTFKRYVAKPLKRIDFAVLAAAFTAASEQAVQARAAEQQKRAEHHAAIGHSPETAPNAARAEPNAGLTLISGATLLGDVDVSAEKALAKAVVAHYKADPAFLWVDGEGRPNAKARDVMVLLSEAGDYGLDAADYTVTSPDDAMTTASLGPEPEGSRLLREAMQFEFALSVAALRYALDARYGRVDPDRVSRYHDFRNNKRKPADAMAALAVADDAARLLRDYHPHDRAFAALKAELAALDTALNGPPPVEIAAGTFIRPGQTSDQLPAIVEGIRRKSDAAMLANHADIFASPPLDGTYTPDLVALVRDFQAAQNLGADGIIGKRTIAKIVGGTPQNKRQKILLAMERLRWHPDTLGSTHVFINQPAYRASLIRDGVQEVSMRAIVGKPANQTNFFHDTIDYVEYNPYWGVPKSILVNEMLPKLRKNPGYLDERNYEITTASGNPVSGWNIDWWSVGGDFPYNVRQRPGPRNALGELKIMFPNKHHIYMHDTPSRNLFKRKRRALSHGCVRLADPKAMAAAVLGSDVGEVQSRISSGRNNTQKLSRKMPVYVAYFTAWPEPDGTIRFFPDIYGRDKALAKALAVTRQARAEARNI